MFYYIRKAENEKYENFNFYIKNDNKDCVQVEDDIGLKNLWQHHLTKMPLTTIDKAQSIIQEYPMPNNLIQVSDTIYLLNKFSNSYYNCRLTKIIQMVRIYLLIFLYVVKRVIPKDEKD